MSTQSLLNLVENTKTIFPAIQIYEESSLSVFHKTVWQWVLGMKCLEKIFEHLNISFWSWRVIVEMKRHCCLGFLFLLNCVVVAVFNLHELSRKCQKVSTHLQGKAVSKVWHETLLDYLASRKVSIPRMLDLWKWICIFFLAEKIYQMRPIFLWTNAAWPVEYFLKNRCQMIGIWILCF